MAIHTSDPFQALVTRRDNDTVSSVIEQRSPARLTLGEVRIRTCYAGVNYKDCLAIQGLARIIREFPRVGGIEAVGQIIESASPAFSVGDQVMAHGFDLGISQDGGFAQQLQVAGEYVQKLPSGLTLREAAILGVPGFTVGLALDRFEANGLTRQSGPIAVSGANGAVGMLAIAILARAGYEVVALTRRTELTPALRQLGASDVLDTAVTQSNRPLETARFAAAIDNVGGPVLSWLLRSMSDSGQVASVGNAAGNTFEGSVLPFFVRRVQIFGVLANAPWDQRYRVWNRLATEWRLDFSQLEPYVHWVDLAKVPDLVQRQLKGAAHGRSLVAYGVSA
ncbi:MAG: YhdH/YhfP family quinone oxidoreductase [Alcaligenes sp.]